MDATGVQAAIAAALTAERANAAAALQAAIAAERQTAATALTAAVNQAVTAGGAGQAGGNPGMVAFSLGPAANNVLLDYTSRTGQKIQEGALAKLPIVFNLEARELASFCASVLDKGELYGYNLPGGILMVPDGAGEELNICKHYGCRTVDQVYQHAKTYAFADGRLSQDSTNLYHCLMASLAGPAKTRIQQCAAEYTVIDTVSTPAKSTFSGALLARIIIRQSYIDTPHTEREIRLQLGALDKYMVACNHDIELFNQHVKDLTLQLASRGTSSTDTLTHVLKGYKECADPQFVLYVKTLESEIDDGKAMTYQTLMQRCENRYKIIVQRKEWTVETPDDPKIIALQAAAVKEDPNIVALKAAFVAMAAQHATRGHAPQEGANQGAPRRPRRRHEAWMKVAPAPGQPTIKVVNGKTYKWCEHLNHGWCMHETKDCRNIPASTPAPAPPARAEQATNGDTPQLVFDKALAALIAAPAGK